MCTCDSVLQHILSPGIYYRRRQCNYVDVPGVPDVPGGRVMGGGGEGGLFFFFLSFPFASLLFFRSL